MNMTNDIVKIFKDNIMLHQAVLKDNKIISQIELVSEKVIAAIESNKKILACGNGGSAADAQHMVGEFVGRFEKERKGLPAIDLTANAPIMTSVANDYEFNQVFARQVESLGNEGDLLIGFSTSGNSKNVVEAFRYANAHGILTVGFLGGQGGALGELSDISIIVPHNVTARIQEVHATIIHIICGIVESHFAGKDDEK